MALKGEHPAVTMLLKQWLKIFINKDGILRRKTSRREQLLIPRTYHALVFTEPHQDMDHLGVERMFSLIRERFYWPQMQKDVEHFVTNICECLKKKKPNKQTRAPMTLIHTTCTYPFEMVSIDFLHLDKCKHGYEYILVVPFHQVCSGVRHKKQVCKKRGR